MSKKKILLLGCLFLPLLIVGGMTLVAVGVMLTPVPEASIADVTLEPSLGSSVSAESMDRELPSSLIELDSKPEERTRDFPAQSLSIDVEEGDFEIFPAAPGEPFRIEATYDESAYELVSESDGDGGTRVAFRKKLGFFASLSHMVHNQGSSNLVRIHLPVDVALDLAVKLRKGSAEIDLTGVSVRSLAIDQAMGEASIRFDERNPVAMSRLAVKARMGECNIRGVGNAGPSEVDLDGRLGDFRIEFGGELDKDIAGKFRLMMGSLRLTIPDDIQAEISRKSVSMGELVNRRVVEEGWMSDLEAGFGETGPKVTLDLSLRMGEIQIR